MVRDLPGLRQGGLEEVGGYLGQRDRRGCCCLKAEGFGLYILKMLGTDVF